MARTIQPSFAKGELGPDLYGRVDTSAYQVGLRTARNLFIHPYGGASNRPGTQFIGPVMNHNFPSLLVDFQFKTTDSYILEIGDKKMRVIRNAGHVTNGPLNITGITQANPAVVTVTSHGYSNGDEVFISGVVGMTQVNGQRYIISGVTTNTFQLTDQVTGANVDSTLFGAYVSGGQAARIYTLTMPYSASDLEELKWVQSADTITFTHRSYPIYELTRTAHDNWTISAVTFSPTITFPRGQTITPNTTGAIAYLYRVTALKTNTLEESLPGLTNTTKTITAITQANPGVVTSAAHGYTNGQEIYIENVVGMTQLNGRRFTISGVTTNTFNLDQVDTTGYTAYVSGGTANQTFALITNGNATANNTISWTAVTGAESYNIYKFVNGTYGLIGNTSGTSFIDSNIAADTTVSPPRARNPFDGGVNPITCTYYQQRRTFGGSNSLPDTTWFTQTGNTSNMNASSPIQDDDAFNVTLTSRQVNEIRHYVPQSALLVFTSGAEWRVDSGQADHFGIDTVVQKPQSEWGTSHLRPLLVNSTVLFVPDARINVRSFGYSYTIDKYTGSDLNLLAPHIFKQYRLTGWALAVAPEARIFGIREDGVLTTLTFDQDQEVQAWTRCDTSGYFERVQTIKNPSGASEPEDGVYFVVKRWINGRYVRYIEKLASRRFTEVEDCFFVDCGLSYDNPVTISNISLTNPVVVTANNHGFQNGDQIDFSNIVWAANVDDLDNETQPEQINGFRYVIGNVTTNTFEITGLDGTGYNAYISGGKARKPTAVVSGLQHLEGREIVALADGNVIKELTVTNGTVVLNRPYSRIRLGLAYTCDLETLNLESQQGNTMQGKLKKLSRPVVRLLQSRGLWYGTAPDYMTEMKQREDELMGEPTTLLTGDKELEILPDWNVNGRLFFRQRDPLPMTILAVIPDVEVGE